MQENIDTGTDVTTTNSLMKDNVAEISSDKELRALKVGSEEYAAKLSEKFGKDSRGAKSANALDTKTTKDNIDGSESHDSDKSNKDGKKDRIQTRIDELTGQKAAAIREAREAKDELER